MLVRRDDARRQRSRPAAGSLDGLIRLIPGKSPTYPVVARGSCRRSRGDKDRADRDVQPSGGSCLVLLTWRLYSGNAPPGALPQRGAALMSREAVLATGGTIPTRTDESGTAMTRAGGREPVGDLPLPRGVTVEVEDAFGGASHAMTREHPRKRARHAGERSEPSP